MTRRIFSLSTFIYRVGFQNKSSDEKEVWCCRQEEEKENSSAKDFFSLQTVDAVVWRL